MADLRGLWQSDKTECGPIEDCYKLCWQLHELWLWDETGEWEMSVKDPSDQPASACPGLGNPTSLVLQIQRTNTACARTSDSKVVILWVRALGFRVYSSFKEEWYLVCLEVGMTVLFVLVLSWENPESIKEWFCPMKNSVVRSGFCFRQFFSCVACCEV